MLFLKLMEVFFQTILVLVMKSRCRLQIGDKKFQTSINIQIPGKFFFNGKRATDPGITQRRLFSSDLFSLYSEAIQRELSYQDSLLFATILTYGTQMTQF